MSRSGRVTIRPVPQGSIADKTFTTATNAGKRVEISETHPLVVLRDLRKGSLKSFAQYLREIDGIPDREVVAELLKLIDGSVAETAYRIIVAEHPDHFRNPGGRKKAQRLVVTDDEQKLLARFDEIKKIEIKHELTLKRLALEAGVSSAKISRAISKRKKLTAEADEKQAFEIQKRNVSLRREAALSDLRRKHRQDS